MAKKAKKKSARRRRKTKPAEVPAHQQPTPRRLTIDSVIYDLTVIKNTLADLL